MWRFIKYCALHKLHCIVHKILYTNCKIYARRVVRIMHIILWMHLTRQYLNYIVNVKYFAQIILHRNEVKLLWMYITPQNEVNIQILKIQAIYISICKTACLILKNVCKIFCRILHNVLGFQNSIDARKLLLEYCNAHCDMHSNKVLCFCFKNIVLHSIKR